MSDIEKIEKELMLKGVQPDVIESVLDSFADKEMAGLIQKSAKNKAFGEDGEKPWEEGEEEKSKKKSKKSAEEDEDMKEKAFGEDDEEDMPEEEKKSKKKSKKAMAEDEEEVKEKSLKLQRLEKSIAEKEIEALKQEVASIRKASKIPSYYAVAKSSHDDSLKRFLQKSGGGEMYITKAADTFRTDENTAGGYLIRPDFIQQILTYVEDVNPLRKFASVGSTSSNLVIMNTQRERNEAYPVGEANNTNTKIDANQFGQLEIKINACRALAGVSRFMLQDSPMNIESHILNILKDAFARYEAKQMLYGDGSNKPLGVLAVPNKTTSDAVEFSRDKIQIIPSGDASDVLLGTKTTGLIGTRTALSAYYKSRAKWYMSEETFSQIQLLNSNTTHHFLELQPSSNKEGRPNYILLGWPVEILPEMLSNTTSKVVIFGDMAQALQIYDHTSGVHLLKDEITNYDEVTFVATQRWGAKVIKPEALKIIKLGT